MLRWSIKWQWSVWKNLDNSVVLRSSWLISIMVSEATMSDFLLSFLMLWCLCLNPTFSLSIFFFFFSHKETESVAVWEEICDVGVEEYRNTSVGVTSSGVFSPWTLDFLSGLRWSLFLGQYIRSSIEVSSFEHCACVLQGDAWQLRSVLSNKCYLLSLVELQ